MLRPGKVLRRSKKTFDSPMDGEVEQGNPRFHHGSHLAAGPTMRALSPPNCQVSSRVGVVRGAACEGPARESRRGGRDKRRCPRFARCLQCGCLSRNAILASVVALLGPCIMSVGRAADIVAWPEAGAGSLCRRLFSESRMEPRWLRLEHQVLRFWEFWPTETTPGGSSPAPVVFVHGYHGDLCDFGPLLVAIARKHHVMAFDLPGFGQSVSESKDESIESYVRLVGNLVGRMRLGRVHLVCHSMGGQVCIGVGLTSPSFLQSLTLIDAAGVYEPSTFLDGLGKRMAHVSVGTMLAVKGRSAIDLVDGNRVMLRHLSAENPAMWTAISSFQSNFRSEVRKLALPVLVIWGLADPIFPIDSACLLKEEIAGATLHVIPGAGHSPQRSHPAETATFIERFYARIAKPTSVPAPPHSVAPPAQPSVAPIPAPPVAPTPEEPVAPILPEPAPP